MRLSQLFFASYKEVPSDAVVASHQLLHRAGYIIKSGQGLYNYSPLMMRVIANAEAIIREELNKVGCLEISMSVLTPSALWEESGRWDELGDLMLRFQDRSGRQLCISPTNEEAVVDYFRKIAKSYKQLPVTLYQINTKFRDEIRPRFGLMRAREFCMKDAYSFHQNKASLDEGYDALYNAYKAIFSRMELDFIIVEADGGDMADSGAKTHEFQVIADSGEDDIIVCEEEGYASNIEAAQTKRAALKLNNGDADMSACITKNCKTIEDVAAYVSLLPEQCLKAVLYEATFKEQTQLVAAFCLGDDSINELKLKKSLGCLELQPATDEQIKKIGLTPGYIGPVNSPEGLNIIMDAAIDSNGLYCCGANKVEEHYINVKLNRDLNTDIKQADIRLTKVSDVTQNGNAIQVKRGIEVGHIFQLGDKYTTALSASVLDENGKAFFPLMGCYGIGVGRTIAAAIEQKHDDRGIVWPESLAPYKAIIIITNMKDETLVQAAENLYASLNEACIDVMIDDRKVSAGIKFKDADLLGIPKQIVVGKSFQNEGKLELVTRATLEKKQVALENIGALLKG